MSSTVNDVVSTKAGKAPFVICVVSRRCSRTAARSHHYIDLAAVTPDRTEPFRIRIDRTEFEDRDLSLDIVRASSQQF
jgi:hypothetical protein